MIDQLILVRHGETEHNLAGIVQGWSDSELSERGRQQVARLAERLKTFEADAIFSSPLQRAMTTAQRIAGATGLEVRTLDGLREMNYGRWEGQSFLDIRKTDESIYRRWVADSSFACPEGESHDDVLARIRGALDSLNGAREREAGEIVADLFRHNDAIRTIATELTSIRSRAVPLFQARLSERLRELLRANSVDPQRLAQEVAMIVDRSDISEEISRLQIHSDQLRDLLSGGGEMGKRMDFLLQEMNRETNTVLSKTTGIGELGLRITDIALACKAEIEKVREQSLNLE